jgi:iron(II)-dependent oxidoreductase
MRSSTAPLGGLAAESQLAALADARTRTLALAGALEAPVLERQHSPLMSPLVWDLGHIAAFEDLWLAHRGAGLPLLRPELAEVYDAFESPRARRGQLPFLGAEEALSYRAVVRARTLELAGDRGVGDGVLHELVVRHEHQHLETMLQTIQLARLPYPSPAEPIAKPGRAAGGLELVEVPAGECTIGAPEEGFAYDNERPRHSRELAAFGIGRAPVSNGEFLEFLRAGGYQHEPWWSPEGWAWRRREQISRPGGWSEELDAEWRLGRWAALDEHRPVVHVSFHEAEAFARAHDARLPTELEWEKAASWDSERGAALPQPWGEAPPQPSVHANLEAHAPGPLPVMDGGEGAAPCGAAGMIGDVWEWTCSAFDGYPGFVAYPYREYSEVFFGRAYRVLRGGSWASAARVVGPCFRNWDFPQRRQIFAGIRIAKAAA